MNKKLYVAGINYETTEDQLREYFSEAGTIEALNIVKDKVTGNSRGFGFVEFASDEEAAKAIDMFNGKDFAGRTLTVESAKPTEDS